MKLLLTLGLISLYCHGSILFEPYIGASFTGDMKISGENSSYSGPSYGARLGAQHMGLFGGVDYRKSSFEVDSGAEEFFLDGENFKSELIYAFVGYEFPMFFKLWAGLAFKGSGDADRFDFEEASGSVLGVGYKAFPWVCLNLEYVTWKFEELDPGNLSDLEGAHILGSVSFPLNF